MLLLCLIQRYIFFYSLILFYINMMESRQTTMWRLSFYEWINVLCHLHFTHRYQCSLYWNEHLRWGIELVYKFTKLIYNSTQFVNKMLHDKLIMKCPFLWIYKSRCSKNKVLFCSDVGGTKHVLLKALHFPQCL